MQNQLEVMNQLVDVALKGQHREHETYNNLREYKTALILMRSLKKITNSFYKCQKKVFKAHVRNILQGICNPDDMVEYNKLCECVRYYTEEYNIMNDDAAEFEAYQNSSIICWIKMFLGFNRND